MSLSSDAVSSLPKARLKFFLDLELALEEDLKVELLARGVTELEKGYGLVQVLDVVRSKHAFRSQIKGQQCLDLPHPFRSSTYSPPHNNDVKGTSFEWGNRKKSQKGNFLRLVLLLNAISAKGIGI